MITNCVNNACHIIRLDEAKQWDQMVKQARRFDFYHTSDYHQLSKDGEPFLFVYEDAEGFIAFPLIKRPIAGTPFYDCTSVYGFGGPVSNIDFNEISPRVVAAFKKSFLAFLKEQQIVSVFSRLHPLLDQHTFMSSFGGVFANGKSVVLDLKKSVSELEADFKKSTRQKIMQLGKQGYEVREATTTEELSAFVNIYHENMRRVNAYQHYFFDEKYFRGLLNAQEFRCILLLVYCGEKIICGAIATFCSNILQLHLGATLDSELKNSPLKLLLHKVMLLGKCAGMDHFHLGGGLGGRQDSLFDFKAGFSNYWLDFHTWRYVANMDIYQSLAGTSAISIQHHFPLYRSMDGQRI